MRTPIELALGVRSYERIVCLTDADRDRDAYPEHWDVPRTLRDAGIDQTCVVVVDGVDLSQRSLSLIGAKHPRLIAFTVEGKEHYMACRRLIKSCYPFADLWDFNEVDMAKLLVTNARGTPYDRDRVVDMRPTETV